MLSRRQLIAAVPAVLVTGPVQAAPPLTVYKTASCGCCTGWITTMRRAGYAPKVVVVEDISPIGARLGVPFELSSCHLTTVGGYVVVGHVPVEGAPESLGDHRPRHARWFARNGNARRSPGKVRDVAALAGRQDPNLRQARLRSPASGKTLTLGTHAAMGRQDRGLPHRHERTFRTAGMGG